MSATADKEQKNIIRVYGAAWAAIILVCVPSVSFAVVSTILFIGLLIAVYIVRKKSEDKSLTHNHMTYIIRSLWFGLFMLPGITVLAATAYLLPNYSPQAMQSCAQPLADHILANPDAADMQTLYGFIAPCMDAFMHDNGQTLLIATLIAALPVLAYLLYRFGNGTMRALKGHRIAKPTSWIA